MDQIIERYPIAHWVFLFKFNSKKKKKKKKKEEEEQEEEEEEEEEEEGGAGEENDSNNGKYSLIVKRGLRGLFFNLSLQMPLSLQSTVHLEKMEEYAKAFAIFANYLLQTCTRRHISKTILGRNPNHCLYLLSAFFITV
ncbi:uncharacterized protein LOC132053645 isoform X2 [Lycium ferocissimum]|uniref:uncharacterized protein LOC132053645 isoform X2 n=1 Tax=Lycium ferocissimum TaxID=112874 RepID=UPI0028161C33|nr:uncharacterized protein LOC132053645 isoform X2 [Lycium ferocissimum]